MSRVRIASWNVNSVKQRVPRLLPWLDQRQPDVVCLQETKLADGAFTELLGEPLDARGYEVAVYGEARWNGVAILSRAGLDDVVAGIANGPGFPHPEARAIAATCGGIRVHSVYVPNGRTPGSDHYRYKLTWLAALRDVVGAGPEAVIVCGDMNIAPTDVDVFDPLAYAGQTHVTPPERAALAEVQALGLRDVVRDRWPGEWVFTYWDYRAGRAATFRPAPQTGHGQAASITLTDSRGGPRQHSHLRLRGPRSWLPTRRNPARMLRTGFGGLGQLSRSWARRSHVANRSGSMSAGVRSLTAAICRAAGSRRPEGSEISWPRHKPNVT